MPEIQMRELMHEGRAVRVLPEPDSDGRALVLRESDGAARACAAYLIKLQIAAVSVLSYNIVRSSFCSSASTRRGGKTDVTGRGFFVESSFRSSADSRRGGSPDGTGGSFFVRSVQPAYIVMPHPVGMLFKRKPHIVKPWNAVAGTPYINGVI